MSALQRCLADHRHQIAQQNDYRGYVYFISDGTAVKIGVSRSYATTRICTLQMGNPRQLQMVSAIPANDPEGLESSIHRYLDENHIRGEWYSMTEEDLAWVRKRFPPANIPGFAAVMHTSGAAFKYFGGLPE